MSIDSVAKVQPTDASVMGSGRVGQPCSKPGYLKRSFQNCTSVRTSRKAPVGRPSILLLSTSMSYNETSFQSPLPNHASSKLFPQNHDNSFGTKLYKTLDLGGERDWDVPFVDIAFPHNWANIPQSIGIEMVLERITKGQPRSYCGAAPIEVTSTRPMGMFTIPKSHYSIVQQLGALMKTLYQKGLLSSSTPRRAGK